MRNGSSKQTTPATVQVNLNTILGGLGTIISGLVLWFVTAAMNTNKDTGKKVNDISSQIPYIQKSIDATDASIKQTNNDVKELRATSVTRNELDNKHLTLQGSIKEVKDDVKEVRTEQKRIAEDILKDRNAFDGNRPHQ